MSKLQKLEKGASNLLLSKTKNKIQKKLEQEYYFTADQINKLFSLWSGQYKALKRAIDYVEKDHADIAKYTELGMNVSQLLYGELLKKDSFITNKKK